MSCDYKPTSYSNLDLNYLDKNISQWSQEKPNIKYADKSETTILFGGLTDISESLIEAAAKSLGENYLALPTIDNKSLEFGKIYGNRGQCNPTYYTVGNLIKYLVYLRDEKGIATEEIIKKYVMLTANGCGPCRFGMYVTEFNKALNDAGFAGFRVVSFEHNKSIFQEAQDDSIVELSPKFFLIVVKSVIIADILNILGYQIRPYEVEKGSTNKAIKRCEELIIEALKNKKSLLKTMLKCRKILERVELNRLQVKPKVMVMGEFWAAMTESDGNYHIHRFLEAEGAEVLNQPLINRILLNVWEAEYLRSVKEGVESNAVLDFSLAKSKFMIFLAKHGIHAQFNLYAKAIGLNGYKLPNMEHLQKLGEKYYPLDSNGGEGHLEVAHLIESVQENIAHLVISVKPFGCMPSSGVSDGIQSLISAKYPNANFLSVETSGEGGANFYSRIQMALFKAKEQAKEEFLEFKDVANVPRKVHNYKYAPKSRYIGTACKLLDSI